MCSLHVGSVDLSSDAVHFECSKSGQQDSVGSFSSRFEVLAPVPAYPDGISDLEGMWQQGGFKFLFVCCG